MENVSSDFLKRRIDQLIAESLKSGGGGGNSGGMEPRIAKLEASVEHIQKDIGEIKADVREFRAGIAASDKSLATLTARVDELPTKGYFVKALLSVLAVIAALTLFQGNLQKAFNVSPTQGVVKP